MLGIGMFPPLSKILGARFVEVIQKQKEQAQRCSYEGKDIR